MIKTRRVGTNCADVGFCRIKGADQYKQHKKRSAYQHRTLPVVDHPMTVGNDKLSRQQARPRRGTSSPRTSSNTSGAAASHSVQMRGAIYVAGSIVVARCGDRQTFPLLFRHIPHPW
jgi:hypothetical protein